MLSSARAAEFNLIEALTRPVGLDHNADFRICLVARTGRVGQATNRVSRAFVANQTLCR